MQDIMAKNEFTVELNGQYHWELLLDIDNTTNSASIKREVEVVSDVSLSYENMVRSLESSSIATSLSLGFNVSGIIDVISVGVKGDLNTEVKSEYEKMSKSKQDFRKTTTRRDTYEVGPGSSLKLYRLVFKGPGVSYTTDTLSTSTDAFPDVPIEVKGRLIPVLRDIEVVWTSDSASRPDDLIQEVKGLNPDINAGYGGDFVWLRAIWTLDVSEGVSGVQVVVQSEKNDGYTDMAKGAGGDYRYLKMLRDPHSKHRITEVALRKGEEFWRPMGEDPWKFATGDINKGRGGDYLYLCWNGEDHQ